MTPTADVVFKDEAILGEGAIWDDRRQRLLWVDITGKRVGLFEPVSRTNHWVSVDSMVGTVVPTTENDLLIAMQAGVARLDPSSGRVSDLRQPKEHDAQHLRFNDGKCDPRGRLWAGTMALNSERKAGALYCFEANRPVRCCVAGVSISNGLAWSLDHTLMYFVDSPTQAVDVFDYDVETGEISNRRRACEIPAAMGTPDGMTIDQEGMLWVALWGGSAVTRWDPASGRLLAKIAVPATQVTSCAFGGADLKSLFITTAREGLSAEQLRAQLLAGSLFMASPGVAGIPAEVYRG